MVAGDRHCDLLLLDTARHIRNGGRMVADLANLVHKRNVLPDMADCIDAL